MSEEKVTEGEIQRLLSQHMREKNREAVSALKMIKTRIATEKGRLSNVKELEGDEILKIVKRELKEIRDTVESLRKAGMEDRVPEEEQKMKALEGLLPASLPRDQIQSLIDETVREIGKENFGQVMKAVMGKVAGKADGKLVSDLVRKTLARGE
jgi:uncharacterized protein YqeY